MSDSTPKRNKTRPDLATLAGLIVGVGGILCGLVMENGKVADVMQITAAVIVIGGTLGAVMVTTPLGLLTAAARKLISVFRERVQTPREVIDEIVVLADKARRGGILSLEAAAEDVGDPFLQKALRLAVDGIALQELRQIMELEMIMREQRGEAEAAVYETAGGYAPTIGIIGAVLGLIQVMKHLESIDEVGKGIAMAFVATVYGVGLANLILLPAAAKLKARVAASTRDWHLMLEGVTGIVEGNNPSLIRIKLGAFLEPSLTSGSSEAKQHLVRPIAKQQAGGRTVGPEPRPVEHSPRGA